jgi:class 3 adenylate cyclase/CHASE2 domain-containing sensor protein
MFSSLSVAHRKRLKTIATFLAASLLCAVAMQLLVGNVSVLSRVDQFVQDWEVAGIFARPEAQDPDIVIVAVDEDTLSQFPYRSPVDRAFLSNLIQKIASHHPAAIESDFLFDQPTEQDKDLALAKTLRTTQVPLVISYVADKNVVTPEQLAFEDAIVPLNLRAMANEPTDQFDTARYVYPGEMVKGHYIPGVARAVAAKVGVKTPAEEVPIIWKGRPKPTDTDPHPKFFKQYPANTAAFLPDSWFRGKIVLIGSDVTLVDRHRTPFSSVLAGDEGQLPGIVIQAHSLSQLLHHKVSPVLGWRIDFLVALLMALIGAGLGVVRGPLMLRIAAAGMVVVAFWAGGIAIWHFAGAMLGMIAPSLALLTAFSTMDSLSGREARKQRAFIQGAFSRYVAPKVVEQMVADPSRMSLEGERREMTFLFSDIQGFTTMSEKLDAVDLARLLNGYLDGMTNIVLKHGGMVDKFIGDAVFAIFNAPIDLPDHAAKAVRCMLELDDFADNYRREQNAAGIPLGITRIGVHTGVAVVGNFGSHARFTYTASGDAVNTAARLEGINKYFGTRLCVSGVTRRLCEGIAFRPIVSAVVKGKTTALDLWEPLHDGALAPDFLGAYENAFDRMRQGGPDAAALFAALLESRPDDPCVKLHIERLRDGATGIEMVMTDK